jgi:hypothetical protein
VTSPSPDTALGSTQSSALPRAILAIAAAIAVALLAPHVDFVPIWDGWAYAECAVDVAANRFALYFLRCYGHPAYAYSGLLGLGQLVDLGNPALLLLVNALVLGATTVGFHRLMRRAFPGAEHGTDVALLTAAFLLQPAFLASVVQPSLDLAVLAGTVWCTVLLVERRWLWCAAAGTAMAFSKETGVMLYGVVLACYVSWMFVRTAGSLVTRVRPLLPLAPTIAPFVLYGGYVVAFLIFRPGQAPLWEAGRDLPFGVRMITTQLDAGLLSYLALLFVLNFAWLPSAWVVASAASGLVRVVGRRPARPSDGEDRAVSGFIVLAAVATLVALTRVVTYSNVRYLLAGTALWLGVAYVALVHLRLRPALRRAALGVYAVLVAVSVVRTVDPVSRRLWGTFPFGSHRMLEITSITGECCGAGRDQLAYSLEFTRLDELTDMALTTLMRDTATVIVLPSQMRYHIIGRLDRVTWKRTLRREGAFEPTVMTGPVVLIRQPPPRSILYLVMPNGKDSTSLAELAGSYDVGPERRFESGGYVLSAYQMTARNGVRAAP